MDDKNIEIDRYDSFANDILSNNNYFSSDNYPEYLKPPYTFYKLLLEKNDFNCNILEIGAGMGENTEFLLKLGFNVCSTDISPQSVEVMKKRFSSYQNFNAMIADMEKLPFDDASFDIVCSAGCLSYGDNSIVMNEIYRVLRQEGKFISVDSLNNNPIFRVNRYLHFLRGNRTKSTLKRMPSIRLINSYVNKFGYADVHYFGSITWLFPLLTKLLKEEKTTALSNYIDRLLEVKKSAFKFTLMAIKK